ncbi:MAG TPA: hypothetical protein DCS43_16970 [Verrucomicrobia bacterium]|nr:hypothetical protein [Verrucomicrobiota bacterium]
MTEMGSQAEHSKSMRHLQWLHFLFPLFLLISTLVVSFDKWADPTVDFGRDCYAAWRVTAGERLYEDIYWFNGPLSVHLNALVFSIVGVSLDSIQFFNLGLMVLFSLLLWLTFMNYSAAWIATINVCVLIVFFGIGQYTGYTLYSYIAPYSHEAVQGLYLTWGVMLLWMPTREAGKPWFRIAGLAILLAAILLTKTEYIIAATAISMSGMFLQSTRSGFAYTLKHVLLPLLATVLVMVLVLSAVMVLSYDTTFMINAWAAPFRHVFNPAIGKLPFYLNNSGLDAPLRSLYRIAQTSMITLICIGPSYLAARMSVKIPYAILLGLIGPTIATVCLIYAKKTVYLSLAAALPVICAMTLAITATKLWKNTDDDHLAFDFILATFGGSLLLKILLNSTISGYGFVLALPAFMLAVHGLLNRMPGRIISFQHRCVFVVGAITTLSIFMYPFLQSSYGYVYPRQQISLAGQGGVLLTDQYRGPALQETLRWIDQHIPSDATFTVLPEGAMLNFLTQRVSTVPILNLMPPEYIMFGGGRILQDFKNSPPDYIVLVDKSMREYGIGNGFGIDFAPELMAWINQNYQSVFAVGPVPFTHAGFGTRILKKTSD